jgi:hypothetical protein
MKTRVKYWSLLGVLAVAFTLGALGAFSQIHEAICIPDPCPGGAPLSTPMVWGFGADCSEALSDATQQAFAYARSDCGRAILVCNFSFVKTASCFYSSSHQAYQQDGYGVYDCASCSPPVP